MVEARIPKKSKKSKQDRSSSPMMSNNLILRTIGDRLLKSTGKGKVCLVTGAASGIGRAAAIAMARQQGRIIVTDLPAFKERGMAVVEEIKQMGAGDAIWCNLDVSQEAQWQSVMDKAERHFGLVDVTINNAGKELDSVLFFIIIFFYF